MASDVQSWVVMNAPVNMQVWTNRKDIQSKTMKTMDRAACLAMMPDYEMYSADLKEDAVIELFNEIFWLKLIMCNNT